MRKIVTGLAVGLVMLGMAGAVDATLTTIGQATYNSSSYNLVYDNDSPFGSAVYLNYTNSEATWANQVAWASSLNNAGTLSYTLNPGYSVDWGTNLWRLPGTVDGTYTYGFNGTTTAGYNITTSEFGHLYYTELGNKGYYDTNGYYQSGYGLTNKGDLTNLQSDWYWSGTEYAAFPADAWYFVTGFGYQHADYKARPNMLGLAVRSGQVFVPEPSTMLLLCGGLAGLAGWWRRERGL